MRKLNWPIGFFPGKKHFDELQAAPEEAINKLAADTVGVGIAEGFALSIAGSTLTAAPGSGWDSRGRRVDGETPLTLDLSSGITRPAAGQFKWVSIYAQFMRVESGEVTDINNVTSTYYSDDGARLIAVEGVAAATRVAAVRPRLTGDVLLGDFLVDHDAAWDSLSADLMRRTILENLLTLTTRTTRHRKSVTETGPAVFTYSGLGLDAATYAARVELVGTNTRYVRHAAIVAGAMSMTVYLYSDDPNGIVQGPPLGRWGDGGHWEDASIYGDREKIEIDLWVTKEGA